jgi:hypothetical protein
MNYKDAANKHKEQFYGGMKYGKPSPKFKYVFPYGSAYKNEEFIIEEIPISILRPRCVHQWLVEIYSEGNIDEPIWVSVGRKFKDGSIAINYTGTFDILDGNHRVLAAIRKNKKTVMAVMPKSHYDFYKEISRDKNS